ncbi:hypothetical protein MSMAW_1710 [Methanosarcina mazei WWM610]|nr:hypothetical protein MmTuc01_2999 [Methanosarcina mazei Tuc01]AKB40701.1 hypothetical protein MSMAW_1710 [Methanosarcina mazei WWM610]AKB61671.1 hypothetical protein MSMAP_1686 [Methanosarcina mazei SarPi]AKB71214.1 hypothetical protein MSMAC_1324 [Methanosarcina mazei C16]UWJ23370.1 hypothetical protein MSMAT_2113 [Methanosarcina mazei TMA]
MPSLRTAIICTVSFSFRYSSLICSAKIFDVFWVINSVAVFCSNSSLPKHFTYCRICFQKLAYLLIDYYSFTYVLISKIKTYFRNSKIEILISVFLGCCIIYLENYIIRPVLCIYYDKGRDPDPDLISIFFEAVSLLIQLHRGFQKIFSGIKDSISGPLKSIKIH